MNIPKKNVTEILSISNNVHTLCAIPLESKIKTYGETSESHCIKKINKINKQNIKNIEHKHLQQKLQKIHLCHYLLFHFQIILQILLILIY